ncbi:MAG: hypothetical protein HZA24_01690 [Nitrospirae bacterium]|nr:hypothetical protein [Nitrospirota bacterium]
MARLGLLIALLMVGAAVWMARPRDVAPPVPPASTPSVSQSAPGPVTGPVEVAVVRSATVAPRAPATAPAPEAPVDDWPELAAHASDGWRAYREAHYEDAAGHFQAAVDGGPADALFGLALSWHRLGKDGEALLMAHQAAAALPDQASPLRLLGELLRADGDLGGAVEAWERAQTLDFDPTLAPLLETARHDLNTDRRFFLGETRHFRARFEGPAQGYLAERVLDMLEEAYSSVGLALGYYPDGMIEAILYTEQAFRDVTRSPQWAGGIYDGRVRLPISGADQDPASLRRVVTHEYVHAALASLLGRRHIPTWLHEGVALNLEQSQLERWARDILARGGDTVPLNTIAGSFMGLSAERADRAYAQSYVLVRSLIARFGMFRLADLLNRVDDGPFERAFLAVYGETADRALERALAEFGA